MKIEYTRKFIKQYYKLSPKIQKQFQTRLQLWLTQPYHPQLNTHLLVGEYAGMTSINITGDIRALYEKIDGTYVIYGFIGTHSQLYK